MKRWSISIEIWPYSGKSQEEAGDPKVVFEVPADDFAAAAAIAGWLQKGIERTANVWMAPIKAVEQV